MGVVGSKSPLERRNTVLRRSQRKSIHGIKSKADKIIKDIKKFKGIEEDSAYIDLKGRIESAERDLKSNAKSLQVQIRHIYNETLKKTEECYKLLDEKLKENQEKEKEKQEKLKEKQEKEEEKQVFEESKDEGKVDDEDDDVFIEEVNEEEQTPDRKRTVELKVIQVEPIEMSPQINKRFSAMKIGVPVMPGSMMQSLSRKTQDLNAKFEEKIANIRKEIENVEIEISQFVGRKNGKYYNKIKRQLDSYSTDLQRISTDDEVILEQIKLCNTYISSCLSFLNEKAVDDDVDGDDDEDEDDVMTNTNDVKSETDNNLSPRSMRTTYI